jgi:hypothetical protein
MVVDLINFQLAAAAVLVQLEVMVQDLLELEMQVLVELELLLH